MFEFDDFSGKKTDTDLLLEQREKIKKNIATKLKKIRFTENQIEEVMVIIDEAEAKIEKIKSLLNGTNINTDDPTPVMRYIFDDIRYLRAKMSIDVKTKILEILKERNKK